MAVLTVFNRHPRCGKTAVAGQLLAAFARRGERPLAIDLDPKGDLSTAFGVGAGSEHESSATLLRLGRGFDEVAQITRSGVVACPAHPALEGLASELGKGLPFLGRLATALATARPAFGTVVIDCAGRWDLLSLNAVIASDLVIVPVDSSPGALEGARAVARGLDALAPVLGRTPARRFLRASAIAAPDAGEQRDAEIPEREWLSTRVTVAARTALPAESGGGAAQQRERADAERLREFTALADELMVLRT